MVLDPQADEIGAIEQDASTLVGSGFHLGILGEAAEGDEDPNVVALELGQERADVTNVLLGLLPLGLSLDAAARRSDGVGERYEIQAAVGTGRADPRDLVPERVDEFGANHGTF